MILTGENGNKNGLAKEGKENEVPANPINIDQFGSQFARPHGPRTIVFETNQIQYLAPQVLSMDMYFGTRFPGLAGLLPVDME